MRGRFINCALPHSLRFNNNCRHPSGQYYPAMIALVDGGSGFAVHRTYLTNTGDKATIAPAKAMLGRVAGGAVHLTNIASNRLIICEGIETGLSLNCGMLSKPANIWVALSTSGMKAINLPDQLGELIIAFDGDKAGLKAGKALIDKARGLGWTIKTMMPPQGQDFNDVLRALAAANKGGEA
nr:toprim domain-containing protein [Bartonella sp. HY038]